MGYCGLKVQPFEVFRDAYIFAGANIWNWQLRSIVNNLNREYPGSSLNAILNCVHRDGWRATVYSPRMDDVCFINVGNGDVSDVSDSTYYSESDGGDSDTDSDEFQSVRMQ